MRHGNQLRLRYVALAVLLFWTWFSAAAPFMHHHASPRLVVTTAAMDDGACVSCQWLHGVRSTLLAVASTVDLTRADDDHATRPTDGTASVRRIQLHPRAPPA